MGKRNTTDDPLVRYFLDEYRLNLLVVPRAGKGGHRDRGWDELRNVPAPVEWVNRRENCGGSLAWTRIARQLGIGSASLRNWVRQAEVDGGQRPGTTTSDAERICRARA